MTQPPSHDSAPTPTTPAAAADVPAAPAQTPARAQASTPAVQDDVGSRAVVKPLAATSPAGPEHDRPMPLLEHVAELRRRLIRGALGVLVAFALAWVLVEPLQDFLMRPLGVAWHEVGFEGKPRLQALGPLDVFLTNLRITVTAAIFFAAPVLFYQLWMFVSPGLYAREKKLVIPFVASSVAMFLIGAAFCYVTVLPFATQWFLTYGASPADSARTVEIVQQYTFPNYTTYVTKLLLGFGGIFEFPLVIAFLAKLGLLTHHTLLRHYKVSVLLIFVIAAILTPPEPITQLFMAVPMVVMFFGSVGLAYLLNPAGRAASTSTAG